MKFIERVRVRNFRSIANFEGDLGSMTIVVGQNDVGKSNLLKSLNLFFNGRTDRDAAFSYTDDFCLDAKVPRQKAREVVVEIVLRPPDTFRDRKRLVWRRTWRREGSHSDVMTWEDGSKVDPRSRAPTWARSLRYRYVPAGKGEDFIAKLLSDFHDTLSQTAEENLRGASAKFTAEINAHTSQVTNEVLARLQLQSRIDLPANLGQVFAALQFWSPRAEGQVPLVRRGDGLKNQHIPILLNAIAEQENARPIPGKVRVNTIWGYEEPENNLETSRTMSLARELLNYSRNVQVLVTTHSPAFYGLAETEANGCCLYVASRHDELGTQFESGTAEDLEKSEHVGVLPYLAKHLRAEELRRTQVEQRCAELEKELQRDTGPVLYVEGPTDVKYLNRAWELANGCEPPFHVRSQNGAGYNWVKDMLLACMYSRRSALAAGLFDCDENAQKAKKSVDELRGRRANVSTLSTERPEWLREPVKHGFRIDIAVEEMLSGPVWEYANEQGWLEPRPVAGSALKKLGLEQTAADLIKSMGCEPCVELVLTKRPSAEGKVKLCKYVTGLKGADAMEAFRAFQPLLVQLASFFVVRAEAAE